MGGKRRSWKAFWWLLGLFLFALVIRLVYAVWLHPPDKFLDSDMLSYWRWSEHFLRKTMKKNPAAAFYPYGTAWLLALLKLVVADSRVALNALWAAVGAGAVPVIAAATMRLSKSLATGVVAGVIAAVYFPFVSFTGYFLSETPFVLLLSLAVLFTLRLADTGRLRDALGLGLAVGVGAWVRPQILFAVGFVFLYWITRRDAFPRFRLLRMWPMVLVLGCTLGISAAFSHYHNGRATIVSQNGGVNRLFGKCHNTILKGRGSWFGLPPYGALDKFTKRFPNSPVSLDPVRGRTIRVPYVLWDEPKLHRVADDCIARAGFARSVKIALTDVALLWGFNNTWPDVTRRPQRYIIAAFNGINSVLFLPPVLFCMFFWGLRRGRERLGLLTCFMWALMGGAAAYIGGMRMRTPWDSVMIVLAITMYGEAAKALLARYRARKARKEASATPA